MVNQVIIDGTPLSNFGAVFTDSMSYSTPSPQFEKVEIDGRNGDLLIDRGRYSNYELKLNGVISNNFQANFLSMRAFLLSKNSYVRIEETEFPNHFRTGRLMGGIAPDTAGEHQIRTFTLSYWCKPQMWLKSGETVISKNSNFTLFNPTPYAAKPLIRVYGYGTLMVGSYSIVIASGATSYIDIDSEIMDCYEGATNRNNLVTMADGFPLLVGGSNSITLSGNITTVEVTPRWFTL